MDPEVDLVADLNVEDDRGVGWSTLADAEDPSKVRPGAMLVAGDDHRQAVVRVLTVDADGRVRFCAVRGSVAENLYLLGSGKMELVGLPPAHWVVTLVDGAEVDIWADGVEGLDDTTAGPEHIVFSVLMDVDVFLQTEFERTGRTKPPGRRVVVAVARFPRSTVKEVRSA
jgi:hypothetical protein